MRIRSLRLASLLPRTFMAFAVDALLRGRPEGYPTSLTASSVLRRSVLANGLKRLHSGRGLNETTG